MIVGRFEESCLHYAREHGYDGIICGHIHNPEISLYDDGPDYLNSGCWTDQANCNALVERADGSIDLIQWDGEKEIVLKTTDTERDGVYFHTLEELNEKKPRKHAPIEPREPSSIG
ncbi:MAG: hypothetical protein R3B67_01315 [Phycisphaerales bacterium]